MRKEMNAFETEIKSGNLWGKRMRYAVHPDNGEIFYYGRDVSKALSGATLITHGLTIGTVCYFKGTDPKGRQINASRFLNTEAILEVVNNFSTEYVARKLAKTDFYTTMIEDLNRRYDGQVPMPVVSSTKTMGQEPEQERSPSSYSEINALKQRVSQLESVIHEYKSKELTRQIDETNMSLAEFSRKWDLAYAMIEEYVNARTGIFEGKMDQIDYRRNLWNNFIIPEVDLKLGTELRKKHLQSGLPYKQLILNAGVIDGFFGIVSSLLKFGKG